MASKKYKNMSKNGTDNVQSPPEVLDPLIPYLNKKWVIWECACGDGNLVDRLLKDKFKVKWSDIVRDPKEDFLTWEPRGGYDAIITNPPYSLKDEFLERAYTLKKPFAFLLPLTAFDSEFRRRLFRRFGVQVLFMDGRVNFEMPNKGKQGRSWFTTAWFTYKMNLPEQLNFTDGSTE